MWRQFTKTQKVLSVATAATAATAATSLAYYMNQDNKQRRLYHSTIQLQDQKASTLPSLLVRNKAFAEALDQKQKDFWHVADREEMIKRLKSEDYDLLVVGGGATGAGVSVDAATRGLKVALVERDDFASGKWWLKRTRKLMLHRHLLSIDQVGSRWCSLFTKGSDGIGL